MLFRNTLNKQFVVFFIAIAILLVCFPTLNNEFVNWDDHTYVYENENIRSIDANFFKSLYTKNFNFWHPLSIVSHALDYRIWGLDPFGHHLTSLILHVLNSILVFYLCNALMMCGKGQAGISKKEIIYVSGIAAILFGIHPLHVEPIAWVSARKDLLSTFFFLLSFITYLKFAIVSYKKPVVLYCASFIFYILALLSKPMAITLPIILLIIDAYPLKRLNALSDRKALVKIILEKLPFLFCSFASALITLLAYSPGGMIKSLNDVSFVSRILVALNNYIFYLVKLLFPMALTPIYPDPVVSDLASINFLLSYLLFMVITVAAFWTVKKYSFYMVAWSCYLIALLPVAGIVQSGIPLKADRYFYLPGIFFFVLAAALMEKFFTVKIDRRYKKMMLTGVSIISVFWAYQSVKQFSVWRNSMALWSHQISVLPNSGHQAYHGRGNVYKKAGEYQLALQDYNKAIDINPTYFDAYFNRGHLYQDQNDYGKALSDFTLAIHMKQDSFKAYYSRGLLYGLLARYQEAIKDFGKSIEIEPKNGDAYYNRGTYHGLLGNYEQAMLDLDKAITFAPSNENAYFNMGVVYLKLGNYKESIAFLSKGLKFAPSDGRALKLLEEARQKEELFGEYREGNRNDQAMGGQVLNN